MISRTQKATRAQTRAHNKRLVLKTIYSQAPISRAEVSRHTSLTRATVSNVVTELLEDGLVLELGQGEKTVGKPPTMLTVAADAMHMLSLDLAGSFHGCIVNLRGEIVAEQRIPVDDRRGDAALELVYTLTETLIKQAQKPLLGIGVGTPGVVDPGRGLVNAINLNWRDLPLRQLLQDRFELDTYLANDAQVGALAQYLFGDHGSSNNLILVKVGQGIGAGIVLNGEIFFGDGYGAGEIGHVVVAPDGKLCSCGHFGCLETMAGSRALMDHVMHMAATTSREALQRTLSGEGMVDIDSILKAHKGGSLSLSPVIERSGRYLGTAIAHLVCALNIRHIYIAGKLAALGDELLQPIRAEVKRRALPTLAEQLEIRISDNVDTVVIKGAAALVLHHQLGLV